MQIHDLTSPSWIERIVIGLGGAILGVIVAIINLVWFRGKTKAETGQISAQEEEIRIGTAIKATDQIWNLQIRMNHMEAEQDQMIRNHREERDFFRSQIEYFEDLERVNRERRHAINTELHRLVLHIKNTEQFMSDNNLPFVPCQIKNHDELVAKFPLPKRKDSN